MLENEESKSRRNALLGLIQKARNDMSRLLKAQTEIENDPILVVEDRDGLLYICEERSDYIYQIMKEWES